MTSTVKYSERLWPSVGVILAVLALGVLTYGAVWPASKGGAVLASVSVVLVVLGWLSWSSPVIEVSEGQLRAGRAQIPVSELGNVAHATGAEAKAWRGPQIDARAYLVIRGWIGPIAKVEVVDADDPTPYWLISTRNPLELAQAIDNARKDTP